MLVRKFYADTSREALRLVRQALGPEAMILSNRRSGNGIEIMAVAPQDVQAVTEAVAPPRAAARAHGPLTPGRAVPRQVEPRAGVDTLHELDRTLLSSGAVARADADAGNAEARYSNSGYSNAGPAVFGDSSPRHSDPGHSDAGHSDPGHADPGRYELVHELRLLRSMLEGQLAAFAWTDLKRRDPAKGETMRRLLAAGFGAVCARKMIEELPEGLAPASALRLTKTRLQQGLLTGSPSAGLVDSGGILALVGPTGVGKTTTVAKLAAECAIKHGAARLALVTTDTYRIGAVDQLRIYGSILGVPVFAIRNEADLRTTLTELRTRHLVLIDTVGMSQRDRRLADQVALLSGATRRVQRVLLLSAVAQASVLEDVVRAYQGDDLAGCILTKIDEALTLGAALDTVIRHKLTLHYVANGQRVPEDLHKPNPLYLVERAFREGAQAGLLDDDDVPFTLAAGQN